MKIILTIIALTFTISVFGQNQNYSSELLKQEMDSIIRFIEEVHPNPYTTISKDALLTQIEEGKKLMPDSLNLIQYYTIISPIISSINDGHTGVKFPYKEWKSLNPYCFPVEIQIMDDNTMIVQTEYELLPAQSRIISINNISVADVVETLLSSISAEENSYKRYHLNKQFAERYGVFYGFKEQYSIIFQNEEINDTIIIYGQRLLEFVKNKNNQQKNRTTKPSYYTFETLNDSSIGYINFKSFSDLGQFELFLDSSFSMIQDKNIDDLIIDLRFNGGGNSKLGDELFQYISKTPFMQLGKTTVKYSRKRKEFYDLYRAEGFLKDLSDSAYNELFQHEYGKKIEHNDTGLTELRNNPLKFTGNVYLLISSQSFSSASNFAWCFQYFDMGTIVGQKTGGHIVSFGDLIYVTLPFSNTIMYVSTKEFYGYGATDMERHGVYPDYEVKANKALDFTIDLIKNE